MGLGAYQPVQLPQLGRLSITGESKESKKSLDSFDRTKLSSLTLYDVPFRQAIAQQRRLEAAANDIQKVVRGRSVRASSADGSANSPK